MFVSFKKKEMKLSKKLFIEEFKDLLFICCIKNYLNYSVIN